MKISVRKTRRQSIKRNRRRMPGKGRKSRKRKQKLNNSSRKNWIRWRPNTEGRKSRKKKWKQSIGRRQNRTRKR